MAGCKVIGIYGGAGSGKSEAVRFMHKNHGAYVIKADDIGHRLYKKNQPGYKAIVRICGKGILNDEKEIDYAKLSQLLFDNDVLRNEVERAVHPMVYAKTRAMISEYNKNHNHGLICFEAALLPDRNLDFIDENWYIHSDMNDRARRMKDTRDYSEKKIESIAASQPSEAEYRQYCDYTVENNRTLKELEENINEAVKHCQRK